MIKAIAWINTNYNVPGLTMLTRQRPAAAVIFGGRYRLMDFALSNMVNAGIRTVCLTTHYYSRSISDHLAAGGDWDLYRKEGGLFVLPGSTYGYQDQNNRFTLKDFLRNKEFLLRDTAKYVIVSTASYVANLDYQDVLRRHEEKGADITLLTKAYWEKPLETQNAYWVRQGADQRVVELRHDKEGLIQNPYSLFMDNFIINREVLLRMMERYQTMEHMDLRTVIAENLHLLKVYPYLFQGYLGRIESMESYFRHNMDLLNPVINREIFQPDSPIHTKSKENPPAYYGEESQVKYSLITSGCRIYGQVEHSLLSRQVVVAPGAKVRNCIIMNRCIIGEDAVLDYVVADKSVTIRPCAQLVGRSTAPLVLGKNAEL